MLIVERLPIADQLIAYQNAMRARVQGKLGEFLLMPDSKLKPEAFHEETRSILINILHQSWVVDPDEYDFFMNEFELLREQYQLVK